MVGVDLSAEAAGRLGFPLSPDPDTEPELRAEIAVDRGAAPLTSPARRARRERAELIRVFRPGAMVHAYGGDHLPFRGGSSRSRHGEGGVPGVRARAQRPRGPRPGRSALDRPAQREPAPNRREIRTYSRITGVEYTTENAANCP